jgi:hypothetical protein
MRRTLKLTIVFSLLYSSAFRELMSFWGDVSMSVSMSMAPLLPPTVEDLPDFDFFSMSMSFPERPDLPEDAYAWWDLSLSYSMPTDEETGGVVVPNDPTPPVPESTTVEEPESEDSDTTAAKGGINASESSSSGNDAPQMILMVVLVGAVAAVLLALYARRSSRVSSNASVMTPSVSAPLV